MPSETEKGVIKPLAANAIHLIEWRLRSIDQTQSRVVLQEMHTCANCIPSPATAAPWASIWTVPRTTKACTRPFPSSTHHHSHQGHDFLESKLRSPVRIQSRWIHVAGFAERQICRDHADARRSPPRTTIMLRTSKTIGSSRSFIRPAEFFTGTTEQPVRGTRCPARTIQGTCKPMASGARRQVHRVRTSGIEGALLARRPMATHSNDPNETQIRYDLYRVLFKRREGRQSGAD